MTAVALILLLFAGVCNGLMDAIAHHDVFKGHPFWGAGAWINKYKDGDPKKGPKFLGSTTFMVSLTDGWHLLKEIMVSDICMSIAILYGQGSDLVLLFISFRILFGIGFYCSYIRK